MFRIEIECSEDRDLCLQVLGAQLTNELTVMSGRIETHVISVPELYEYSISLTAKKTNNTIKTVIENIKKLGKRTELPSNIRNEKLYEALARLSYLYLCICITKE